MTSTKQGKPKNSWVETSAQDFLRISDSEASLIEVRLSLALALKDHRVANHLTQAEVAKHLNSSQSRVAKMEAADSSVSIDLMIRGLLKLDADLEDIARIIAPHASEEVISNPKTGVHVTSQRQHFHVPWAPGYAMTSVFEKIASCKTVNGLPL